MSRLSVKLQAMGACKEAVRWAQNYSNNQKAWDECPSADWMLWLLVKVSSRKLVVRCACACARTALKFIPLGELRPLHAIEAAERWARGKATVKEVHDAADAAYTAAAYTADAYIAAAYTAAAAAYAAAAYTAAAYAAAAADAADAAADAAAYTAAYTAAAYTTTRFEALAEMADLIRCIAPKAPLLRRI